jgi:hypothetical protein
MKKITKNTVFTPFQHLLLYSEECNDYVIGFYCGDSGLFRVQFNHSVVPYVVSHYAHLPKPKRIIKKRK